MISSEAGKPLVSAVVTTRNEAADIGRLLESLREQSYRPLEVVVVDNQSTDGTLEIASRHADMAVSFGPERSAQRNEGARLSHGAYLFFLDADMELTPGVVHEAVAAALAGADAVIVPERSVGEGLWSHAKALERSCYVGDEAIEAPRFFARSDFERFGGYDEALTGPEDWDLPARMRGHVSLGRTAAEIVHHEGRLTLRSLARRKYYYGRTALSYARRHPGLASRQVTPIRPAFIREWRRLARQPLLAAAMIVMKAVELSAMLGGAVAELADRRS